VQRRDSLRRHGRALARRSRGPSAPPGLHPTACCRLIAFAGRQFGIVLLLRPVRPIAAGTGRPGMTEAKARLPGVLPGFPDAGSAGRRPGWAPCELAWPMRSSRVVPRWAVACAGLSPALLTGAWLAADILQPASCSPVRQTISALAGHGGTDRWLMTAALFLMASCHLAVAAGLTGVRWPARPLLVIAGVCSAGIAASPVTADGPTSLHLAWTAVGAVTIAVWPAVAGWRAPPRPVITGARGPAMVTTAAVEHGSGGVYDVVDDDPAPVAEWVPALAQQLAPKKPTRVPRFVGRLFAGEAGAVMMTEIRGASNPKARRNLAWQPGHPASRSHRRARSPPPGWRSTGCAPRAAAASATPASGCQNRSSPTARRVGPAR